MATQAQLKSARELVTLFNEGALGKILAERFNGKAGRLYPRKDDEFIMGFESDSVTPTVEQIAKAVSELYVSRGYKLSDTRLNGEQGNYMTIVSANGVEECMFVVVITTRYPHDHNRNYLRVTTDSVF